MEAGTASSAGQRHGCVSQECHATKIGVHGYGHEARVLPPLIFVIGSAPPVAEIWLERPSFLGVGEIGNWVRLLLEPGFSC